MDVYVVWYSGPDGSELIAAWTELDGPKSAQAHFDRLVRNKKLDYNAGCLRLDTLTLRGKIKCDTQTTSILSRIRTAFWKRVKL